MNFLHTINITIFKLFLNSLNGNHACQKWVFPSQRTYLSHMLSTEQAFKNCLLDEGRKWKWPGEQQEVGFPQKTYVLLPSSRGHFHNFTTSSQGSLKFCLLDACCDPIVTKQASLFGTSPTARLTASLRDKEACSNLIKGLLQKASFVQILHILLPTPWDTHQEITAASRACKINPLGLQPFPTIEQTASQNVHTFCIKHSVSN